MIKKPQTVGELFEHFQKIELDMQASRNNMSKLEHIPDDFILSESGVKTETKMEYHGVKEEENQQPTKPKSREVTQLLTIKQSNSFKDTMKIKLSFVEPPLRKKRPQLQSQPFHHEDVWDPSRQLRCRMSSESVCIANMVQLPPQKHRLNEPRPYKPLQPLKKKMYRPAVPVLFRGGFDQFLRRRQKNRQGNAEIDLGVWSLDEVLEECYNRDIIPLALYNQFINRNGHLQIRRFLQAWQGAQLTSVDFKRTTFTLMDHRRLSELLIHCYPQFYTLGSIEALHNDVKEFIAATYRFNSDDYVQSYLLLDEISETGWWQEVKARMQSHPDHASYFQLKETINKPPLPAEMQYDKHSKSQYIRDLLGPIPIADSQNELEKILSMKHKNNKGENRDDSATTSFHRDNQDQDFQESHDRTEITSQQSRQGQGEKSGPDWDVFQED